jgi:uncharacterized protein
VGFHQAIKSKIINEFWISLPVKNVKRSKQFFTEIGFSFNETMAATTQPVC